VAQGDDGAFLVLEFLAPGGPARDFDGRLGRGLAALHRARADRFGFHADNYCGTTPQSNTWCDSWVIFYRDSRLGAQVCRAARAGLLTGGDTVRAERLLARLGDWIGEPPEGPALLHGDLWSGNLHTLADGDPALLDPAAYYGHREAELGMMTLFGGFSPQVYAAYAEAFPLEPGWRERNRLYQLYHLLNHLNLFGMSYYAPVMGIVDAFA
jgi:fructosamine-3-kinase